MTAKILVYIAFLLTAVSAQESDPPSDIPSMSPGFGLTPTMVPDTDAQGSPTMAPVTGPNPICELCGPGREVGDPDFEIVIDEEMSPEETRFTCSQLQTVALQGNFTSSECSELVSLFESRDPCQCQDSPVTSPSAPSPSPSEIAPSPTAPPTALVTSSAVSTVWSVALASLLVATTASMAFIA